MPVVAGRGDEHDAALLRVAGRREIAWMIAFCSLSLRQLKSHGSAKKLMFTTSRCWSPA